MMVTIDQLVGVMGCLPQRAMLWQPYLAQAMEKYQINTPARAAAFLAQVGHESGRLFYVRELWNPEQCPWQEKYEVRVDLGNTEPGDGFKFRGRGLIQITGRANYRACSEALANDFVVHPELLEHPRYAALSAAWFWQSHGCNEMADCGDFRKITRTINGGFNGYEDRLALFNRANAALINVSSTLA